MVLRMTNDAQQQKILSPSYYVSHGHATININVIKRMITSSSCSIVSFNIFNTLLMLPCIDQSDIFYLIDAHLQEKHHIQFAKYRLAAAHKFKNQPVSFEQIYRFIRTEFNLDNKTISIMKRAELNCALQLSSRREDIYELYNFAIRNGKKVIVTSDSYLPAAFLKKMLHLKGYNQIETIYTAGSYHASKQNGVLYQIIKHKENTSNILHIGSNLSSDYDAPYNCGLKSIHYPSIKDIVFSPTSIYYDIYPSISDDPIARILLAHTYNKYFSNTTNIGNNENVFLDFEHFILLGLAPVVFHITTAMGNNPNIQNNYATLMFASRDGYLPKLAYDIYAQYKPVIPSRYVYAGRRANFSAETDSFKNHTLKINARLQKYKTLTYPIEKLLTCFINNPDIIQNIMSDLSENEKKLCVRQNIDEVLQVLSRHEDLLEETFQQHREEAVKYYETIKTQYPREVVFDCGYSGSVSISLSKLMNKPVDKIYLWQNSQNSEADYKNNTKTFLLLPSEEFYTNITSFYEELFSPPEGACIGFKDKSPLIDDIEISPNMQMKYEQIQKIITEYMHDVCNTFREYLPHMNIKNVLPLQQALTFALTESPFKETNLFNDIVFPNPVHNSEEKCLAQKITQSISKTSTQDSIASTSRDLDPRIQYYARANSDKSAAS